MTLLKSARRHITAVTSQVDFWRRFVGSRWTSRISTMVCLVETGAGSGVNLTAGHSLHHTGGSREGMPGLLQVRAGTSSPDPNLLPSQEKHRCARAPSPGAPASQSLEASLREGATPASAGHLLLVPVRESVRQPRPGHPVPPALPGLTWSSSPRSSVRVTLWDPGRIQGLGKSRPRL